MNDKIDMASHEITLNASKLMSSETLNLQTVHSNSDINLYLWGNLSKNPR
mgnify:CR=1 FL=1